MNDTPMKLSVWHAGEHHVRLVHSFAEASAIYCEMRDASGEGGSTWRDGRLYRGEEYVARISYNGRVWAPGEWAPGAEPLYCNRGY